MKIAQLKYPIILLLIICSSINLNAQEYKFEEIAKAFQYGNFKKCHKLSEKAITSSPKEGLLYVYKALSIYEGQGTKPFIKLYPTPLNESLDLLKKSKSHLASDDKIPPTFFVSLKKIQNEAIRPIKSAIKKRDTISARKLLDKFTSLFDNTNRIFENQSTNAILSQCKKVVENSKKEPIEAVLKYALTYAQQEVKSLLNAESSNTNSRRLQKTQVSIYNQIQSLIKMGHSDLGGAWENVIMDNFDNSMEQKRNYFAWEIYVNKQHTFPKEAMLESKLYANLKADIKQLTDKEYSFEEWNDPIYMLANTGENADYLTRQEKNVLYIINLCRINPKLFEATYLKRYLKENPDEKGSYASSLKRKLKSMDALFPFQPDSLISLAAQIHAKDYGEKGKEGHGGLYGSPEGRMKHFGCIGDITAECCDYGMETATEIILHLLVDNGVAGVGHRKILLDPELRRTGISIQPHKQYDVNCVMDFMD